MNNEYDFCRLGVPDVSGSSDPCDPVHCFRTPPFMSASAECVCSVACMLRRGALLEHILGCLCSFRVRHALPANSRAITVSLCYFYLAYITQNSQACWWLSGCVCGICAGFQNLLSLYSIFTVSRGGSKLRCLRFPGFSTSALFNCGLNNRLFWGVVLRVGECTVVFLTLLHKMLTVSPPTRYETKNVFRICGDGGGGLRGFPMPINDLLWRHTG